MLRIAGFVLFAAGAACATCVWFVDRQLQAYRLAEKPSSAYLFVPLRLHRELYMPEARHLVDRAWWLIRAMYGLAIAGMVLIAAGS